MNHIAIIALFVKKGKRRFFNTDFTIDKVPKKMMEMMGFDKLNNWSISSRTILMGETFPY